MYAPSPSPNLSKNGVSPTSFFHLSCCCSSSSEPLFTRLVSHSTSIKHLVTACEVRSSTPTGPRTAYTSLSISPTQLRSTRVEVWRFKNRKWSLSACDARKPPIPMEMAPAMSSAMPPKTTNLDSPRDERPAVRAKGTVRPSERPITLEQSVASY